MTSGAPAEEMNYVSKDQDIQFRLAVCHTLSCPPSGPPDYLARGKEKSLQTDLLGQLDVQIALLVASVMENDTSVGEHTDGSLFQTHSLESSSENAIGVSLGRIQTKTATRYRTTIREQSPPLGLCHETAKIHDNFDGLVL